MGLLDIYIITAILGVALLFLGVRLLINHCRTLLATETSGGDSQFRFTEISDRTEQTPAPEPARDLTITFRKSDKAFAWDPEKKCLLDFIQAKGIEAECLCGAGECGSCRTRLIEGEVEYLLEPKVAPGEGFCLLCVTVPKTDLVLSR